MSKLDIKLETLRCYMIELEKTDKALYDVAFRLLCDMTSHVLGLLKFLEWKEGQE